jgi:hypothetical protein
MVLCQAWGYNGSKRKYRLFACILSHCKSKLKTEMFDTLGQMASLDHATYTPYKPMNMKAHIEQWVPTISDAVAKMKCEAVALYTELGKQSCYVETIVTLLYYEQEKAKRLLARCVKTDFMEHDLQVYECKLHKEMKRKEKKIYKRLSWTTKS